MSENQNKAWQTLGEFIRSQRELANLSLRQLADIAHVSNPYLGQIEKGLYKPSAEVLKNIASALQISAETMYAQAGLLDEDTKAPPGQNVEQAIRLDPHLTTDQKDTMIRIYRGFTARE